MKIKFKSSFQQCCLFLLACYSPDKAKKVIYKAAPMHSMGYRTHGGKVDSTPGKFNSFCLLFDLAIPWRNHTQILFKSQFRAISSHKLGGSSIPCRFPWRKAQLNLIMCNWTEEHRIVILPNHKRFFSHWGKLQLCLSLLHYVYPQFIGPIVHQE